MDRNKIKNILVKGTFLSFFILLMYLIINSFNYFDPFNFCYVNIKGDFLKGNKKTIIEAIKVLKREKPGSYQRMCKYVNEIREGYCDFHSGYAPKDTPIYIAEGCYIRGSKIIYLKPNQQSSSGVAIDRANLIEKYSKMSKDFWNSN